MTRYTIPVTCRAVILWYAVFYALTSIRVNKGVLSELITIEGARLYVLILIVTTALLYAGGMRIYRESPRVKPAVAVLVGCFVISLYYFDVLAFSYGVYGYIPTFKGGGDYSESPDSVVYFRDNYDSSALKSIDPELIDGAPSLRSKRLKIIHESPMTVYVAISDDAGGPLEWRRGTKVPEVFAIRRESIASIKNSKSQGQEAGRATGG